MYSPLLVDYTHTYTYALIPIIYTNVLLHLSPFALKDRVHSPLLVDYTHTYTHALIPMIYTYVLLHLTSYTHASPHLSHRALEAEAEDMYNDPYDLLHLTTYNHVPAHLPSAALEDEAHAPLLVQSICLKADAVEMPCGHRGDARRLRTCARQRRVAHSMPSQSTVPLTL